MIPRILMLFSVCIMLASCQRATTFGPQLSDNEITSEENRQQKLADDVDAQGGLRKKWKNNHNMHEQFERVGERIENAGAQLCKQLHLQKSGCYYYFQTNRDKEINATSDGRNITINLGMQRFVDNDDELAVVMAHELAHNLMRHHKALTTNAILGIAVGSVLDSVAGTSDMTSAMGQVGQIAYSIEFEQEADYVGLYVVALAGYDFDVAADFWQRMYMQGHESERDYYNDNVLPVPIIDINITHPSDASRTVAMKKTMYEINYKRAHHLPLLPDFKNRE